MEGSEVSNDVVHPEVRAHITSLVSALGGRSADEDGRYTLGDDALEVLRDLKRWIRFYDEKTNRMDVARCLAESNIVNGDLLPILATWPENASDNKFKTRIALACFELLVPLTWPIDRDLEKMTVNHHRHLPVLQLAQLGYKRAIINFDGAQVLHAAVRIALPALAMPIGDRSPRDQGIIKLMLFFLRNMAQITTPPGVRMDDGDESQVSRSATIDAFSYQDIFLVLLTIASNMGEDFRTEDTVIMEILFHLVKRVDIRKLFMEEKELNKAKAGELAALMSKEAAMLSAANGKRPTRHNRFGTMVWVKRADGKMSSLSGQDALRDSATRRQKMDNVKTFRPPRKARKDELEPKDLGPQPRLNARANNQLRGFVEEFLDSGFNPLFQHVRKSIDREAPHVLDSHRRQFFYLVAWFLEAERTRREVKKDKSKSNAATQEVSSFNLVAGVLDQSMFIILKRSMSEFFEHKEWTDLAAALRCFTQILLTVQEMSESPSEDDQEIAENMLSRLFYDDVTHDMVVSVLRQYKDQSFDYLDAATELAHHFTRILEAYSKQNVDMQVASRRRVRKKRKAAKAAGMDVEEDENDNSDNDEADAERVTKERKFDFTRFAHRFTPQPVVDAYVALTKFYKDLDDAQLKRAHRYFYRLAFKQDMSVMLFRVDIIHLLYNMIKGPEPLEKGAGVFKEWEELVKQVLRKCTKKIEDRPALLIEMLFSKMNSTVFFLEHGYDQITSTAKPRPAAVLEFRHTVERAEQLGIVVGSLLDRNHGEHINWVKRQLVSAESERRAWEAAEKTMPSTEETQDPLEESQEQPTPALSQPVPTTVRPDNDDRKLAMFKNSYLRLLMDLVGFQRLTPLVEETLDDIWIVKPDMSADWLKETLELINQAEFSPPVFDEGVLAEHQLRRKAAPRKKANFDDDDEDGFLDDIEFGFAAGPSYRAIDGAAPAKKSRRLRRKGTDELPDDEELAERARNRRQKQREKAAKIKSEMDVGDSADESDFEDFARKEREERLARQAKGIIPVMESQANGKGKSKAEAKKKRKSDVLEISSDEESDDELDSTQNTTSSRRRSPGRALDNSSSGSDSDDESDATPLSSSPHPSAGSAARKKRRLTDEEDEVPSAAASEAMPIDKGSAIDMVMDDDEDELPVAAATRRPRMKGGFVIESSDEE